MVTEKVDDHSRFVRMDVAAIVLLLFISAIILSIQGMLAYGLISATLGFSLVGFSVARLWHKELASEQFVELEPLSGILVGGIMIAILQTIVGFTLLDLHFMLSVTYGIAVALFYDAVVFFIAFFNLPSDDYRTKTHPEKDSDRLYVFDGNYYIKFIEEEALRKQNNTE